MKKQTRWLMLATFFSASFAAQATLTQTILSAEDAIQLIDAASKKADDLHASVCIAVLDQSGLLLAFKRMDNAPVGCIDAAIEKGRAAALFRSATDKFMTRANGQEPAIATLPGMVPLGGGSPVQLKEKVIGAVGVSGSSNPNEIAIAQAGSEGFK